MHPSGEEGQDLLIVEDDADLREILELALVSEGYRVATARNGAEALERLRSQTKKPRLILLDLMMPVMNGWEFRDERRQDPELADIPMVVLSAATDFPMRASDIRADAYLRKPLHLDRLLETIHEKIATPPS